MAHMPADGSFDSTNSSNTDDDDGVRGAVQGLVKKDVRGVSCIAAWCNGRHSVAHPVVRITVQPKQNQHKWRQELRTLLQYLRRSDDYIDGVIAAYEAASKEVLPPIVEGQKRLTRKQCDYRVHTFHFLSVVSGGGHGRPSKFVPYDSVDALIRGDPVFDVKNPVFYTMLRQDVAAQMRIQDPITWSSLHCNIPPTATLAFVAHMESVEQKR